ncbi:uncharacterized protein KRP23_9719 [Phytophthora ramorum]|uniref:uncharacterized protein n=1 Tax=Phytophthora ramorum TaxID=164328 RepID=UPI0030B05F74|nr:hypothetical protein KRP23_9719 [Phytophthora ramorum]
MTDQPKPLAALLTLAVAKAGSSSSFREKLHGHHTSQEEQQTQSMMYAARMTYLDDSDQKTPDPLFLTRKQAQKMAQQNQDVKVPLKRLETRKMNTANTNNGPTVVSWKKGRAAMAAMEKQHTWVPRFQAGCHFYECVETGECRVFPNGDPGLTLAVHNEEEADSDEDDPPFPESFAFLNGSHK